MRALLGFAVALALAATPAAAHQQQIAKQRFGAVSEPDRQAANPLGTYNRGCLAGAEQLPETGPAWQAMRLSRNRNWGHPEMIRFLEDLGAQARRIGWPGIYVGDISQPRGGPLPSGHASHQIGLDADVWLLPPSRLDLTPARREQISMEPVVRPDLRATSDAWTPAHYRLVMAALADARVARIFVSGAIKMRMCADASPQEKPLLRKLRPWWGHTEHFHVRLNCPAGAQDCVGQAPPPPGDGCAGAVWWVTDALRPPDPDAPKPKPKPELTLADLPAQCTGVLDSR